MSQKEQQGVRNCQSEVFATGLPYPGVYTAGESDQGGERRVQEGPGQRWSGFKCKRGSLMLCDVFDSCFCFILFSSFYTCGDCPNFHTKATDCLAHLHRSTGGFIDMDPFGVLKAHGTSMCL